MQMINTRFANNWNGKLSCSSFTTIRLYNESTYATDSIHEIFYKDLHVGRARVIDMKKLPIDRISDWIGFLDTGYSGAETQRILRTMYKKKEGEELLLSFVLFKWVKRYVEPAAISDHQVQIGDISYCIPKAVFKLIDEFRRKVEDLQSNEATLQ